MRRPVSITLQICIDNMSDGRAWGFEPPRQSKDPYLAIDTVLLFN